jgi:hypothetical protein
MLVYIYNVIRSRFLSNQTPDRVEHTNHPPFRHFIGLTLQLIKNVI